MVAGTNVALKPVSDWKAVSLHLFEELVAYIHTCLTAGQLHLAFRLRVLTICDLSYWSSECLFCVCSALLGDRRYLVRAFLVGAEA